MTYKAEILGEPALNFHRSQALFKSSLSAKRNQDFVHLRSFWHEGPLGAAQRDRCVHGRAYGVCRNISSVGGVGLPRIEIEDKFLLSCFAPKIFKNTWEGKCALC